MKKWLMLLLLFVFMPLRAGAEPMTLEIVDGDVRSVLASIARLSGLGLVLDDSVGGRISLSLKDIEPEEALLLVARTKGLLVEHDGSVLLVGAPKDASAFYRMHRLPILYADLDTALAAVKLSLGEAGIFEIEENKKNGKEDTSEGGLYRTGQRLMVDSATNSLLLYGTEQEAEQARKTLAALDVPTEQVSLEAHVVAVEKNAAKELGVDWSWSQLPVYPYAAKADGKTEAARRGINGETPGIIRFGRGPAGLPFEFYYSAKISALVSEGKATVLARPNIATLQGREAVINIGGSVPVPETQTTNSTITTSIVYKPTGIILRCTPRIHADGQITAAVHTEVSSPVYVDELKAYKFQERSADTTVRLRDGETMVIGGLIGSEETRNLAKVPLLGDLPILGSFFRSVRRGKTDSEIMIFLTAHILRALPSPAEGTVGQEYGKDVGQ